MYKSVFLAITLVLFTAACTPVPPPEPWRPVPFGMIKAEGVTIEAENGDFVLRSGERFETPFDDPGSWTTWGAGGLPAATSYSGCNNGCRKVQVTVPGQSNKLHGILHFARMHPDARGPGTRSYLIQIPQRYVDEARDGRVSVVYESVSHTDGEKQSGWTLWLSDVPFSDCGDPC